MSRDEPTLVERLIQEKAALKKKADELETYRRNIRLGGDLEIQEPPRQKRLFWRERPSDDGVRREVPASIVSEFYEFTHTRSSAVVDRIREINAELNARSMPITDSKEP